MKRLYLVSFLFAPLGRADGVNRTHLVKLLVDEGWAVEVITGTDYRSLIHSYQRDPSLMDMLPSSVRIHRFNSTRGWLRYDAATILKRAAPCRQAWIEDADSRFTPQLPGILYAIVPPIDNALLAWRLAKRYGFPTVLHFVDEFMLVPAHVVRNSCMLVAATKTIRATLDKRYQHPNIQVVHNGHVGELPDIPACRSADSPLRIIYAGSFNFNTSVQILPRACAHLKHKRGDLVDRICIDFFGPVSYYYYLFLWRYQKKYFNYRGYITFHDLLSLMPHYDVAFASTARGIPFTSKVYHYLYAGLPILAASSSDELLHFVEENQIGVTSPLKVDALSQRLLDLAETPSSLNVFRENVLRLRDRYSLRRQVKRLAELLDEIRFH